MKPKELFINDLSIHYWNSNIKNERVFLASEIMKQLGYKGGSDALRNHNLIKNTDYVIILKKNSPLFFAEITRKKLIGKRSGTVIMLYESGVHKLLLQSRKDNIKEFYEKLTSKQIPVIIKRYKENNFFESIIDAFNGFIKIERQYSCLNYNLDGYIKKYNIIIECDENNHSYYNNENEKKRTELINNELKKPIWIRFNPDSEISIGKVINKILLTIKKIENETKKN